MRLKSLTERIIETTEDARLAARRTRRLMRRSIGWVHSGRSKIRLIIVYYDEHGAEWFIVLCGR